MKKKTLLIRLKYDGFPIPPPDLPLGLLYIAAALESDNKAVVVRDMNRQEIEGELWAQIRTGEIGMVGITMLSYIRAEAYSLIRLIKEINPNVLIVVGGIFAIAFPEKLLERHPIDVIVVGEGEQAAIELARYVETGEGLKEITGIYSRKYGKHEPRPLSDIDTIAFPAWNHSGFDWFKMTCAALIPNRIVNGIRLGDARWAPIIASRGCVGRCVFCNAFEHWGNKVRFRSAQNILDEIEILYHDHGIRLFAFNDDAFPMWRSQCVEFCEGLMERGLKIAWQTTTRGDGIDKELCQLMQKSGCFMIAVGIESGSPAIHAKLDKMLSLKHAEQALIDIREAGMISYALLMIGNPGESDETISDTIEFLKRAKPTYNSFVRGVMIVPGTRLYDIAEEAGLVSSEFWLEENSNGLPLFTVESDMSQFNIWANRIDAEVQKCL